MQLRERRFGRRALSRETRDPRRWEHFGPDRSSGAGRRRCRAATFRAPSSERAGHPVAWPACVAGPVRSLVHPVTLMSEASIGRLAEEAGRDVDGRRFRMLFTIDGCEPHEEDMAVRTLVRVGQAVVRVAVPVDRCAATTRDPDTGARDLDTLRLIKAYRGCATGRTSTSASPPRSSSRARCGSATPSSRSTARLCPTR